MAAGIDSFAQRLWYGGGHGHWLLAPLSLLFAIVAGLRRWCYRSGLIQQHGCGVPLIVVGNIAVGGTGKTPLVGWLAVACRERGHRVAVVSRGYGGAPGPQPVHVRPDSDPRAVGDEPLMLAQRHGVDVFVHPDRVAAARAAVAAGAELVLADDGLQHYRLHRDAELIVVDGERGLGNGWLLPAGPLRESASRLATADAVLVQVTGGEQRIAGVAFSLAPAGLVSLAGKDDLPLSEIAGRTVHAVAAIGHPERFFRTLEALGAEVIRHPLPDHATPAARDLAYDDGHMVIMTEKDAAKLREPVDAWYLRVDVSIAETDWLDALLARVEPRGEPRGEGA